MEYIKINKETNDIIEHPYFIGKLFEENPNTSFPDTIPQSVLIEYGVYEVIENEKPIYNTLTQTIYKGTPYILNDSWNVDWLIRDLTVEELHSKVNYVEFWNTLIQDSTYQKIKQQASQSLPINVICTEFISLMSEAKMRSANPILIQMTIDELINALSLTTQEYDQIQLLMSSGNMNLIYTLPPHPQT